MRDFSQGIAGIPAHRLILVLILHDLDELIPCWFVGEFPEGEDNVLLSYPGNLIVVEQFEKPLPCPFPVLGLSQGINGGDGY
jgi:hypothetical protein